MLMPTCITDAHVSWTHAARHAFAVACGQGGQQRQGAAIHQENKEHGHEDMENAEHANRANDDEGAVNMHVSTFALAIRGPTDKRVRTNVKLPGSKILKRW